MSWAAKRRFLILLIVGAVVAAILFIFSFAVFYKAPTCSDNVQNQGEAGIDCGGPCQFLCQSQAYLPTVLYTKAIQSTPGRTDVVASIENKNAGAAAKAVPYTITLYGKGQSLIQKVSGTVDLPPGATVPVYALGIASGKQVVTSAFLDIDPSAPQWFSLAKDPRIVPAVSNQTLGGTPDMPRIDAILSNPSVTPLRDVHVIVIVHNSKGDVIAASQTVVHEIPAQSAETATFTWNTPFTSIPTNIEIRPLIPLPDQPLYNN